MLKVGLLVVGYGYFLSFHFFLSLSYFSYIPRQTWCYFALKNTTPQIVWLDQVQSRGEPFPSIWLRLHFSTKFRK